MVPGLPPSSQSKPLAQSVHQLSRSIGPGLLAGTIPLESQKLSATAILRDGDSFAAALDRAIMRSGKLIEAKAQQVD